MVGRRVMLLEPSGGKRLFGAWRMDNRIRQAFGVFRNPVTAVYDGA
jgi:hypothetical protein